MAMLEDALTFALKAHAGQTDKLGEPYIGHIIGVVAGVRAHGGNQEGQMAAALHDVLEDTQTTLTDLAVFPPRVVELVTILTRKAGEPYEDYIANVCLDASARLIKLCDLIDNRSPRRFTRLSASDQERLWKKYSGAMQRIIDADNAAKGYTRFPPKPLKVKDEGAA